MFKSCTNFPRVSLFIYHIYIITQGSKNTQAPFFSHFPHKLCKVGWVETGTKSPRWLSYLRHCLLISSLVFLTIKLNWYLNNKGGHGQLHKRTNWEKNTLFLVSATKITVKSAKNKNKKPLGLCVYQITFSSSKKMGFSITIFSNMSLFSRIYASNNI